MEENGAGEDALNALHDRHGELYDIPDTRAVFTEEHRKIAGCIVSIGRDGFTYREGLVRPEDAAVTAADEDTSIETRPPLRDTPKRPGNERGAHPGVAPAPERHREGAPCARLRRRLRTCCCSRWRARCSRPAARRQPLGIALSGWRTNAIADALGPDLTEWLTADDRSEGPRRAPSALRRRPPPAARRLRRVHTVEGQLASDDDACPELEATIERLRIDWADEARPGAADYWSQIPKAKTLAVARATLGDAWARRPREGPKTRARRCDGSRPSQAARHRPTA